MLYIESQQEPSHSSFFLPRSCFCNDVYCDFFSTERRVNIFYNQTKSVSHQRLLLKISIPLIAISVFPPGKKLIFLPTRMICSLISDKRTLYWPLVNLNGYCCTMVYKKRTRIYYILVLLLCLDAPVVCFDDFELCETTTEN